VLVVFDTVVDLARVDAARAALGEAVKGLKENYWVGLMIAQDGLSVLQEPTADRAALGAKIQAVPVSGKAGLLDTLEPVSRRAAGMMQKAGVRVSVLYVTDSGIANYQADYLNPVINASDAGDLSRRFSDRAVQERVSQLSQWRAGAHRGGCGRRGDLLSHAGRDQAVGREPLRAHPRALRADGGAAGRETPVSEAEG
jgi:hypothetical protein